MFVSARRLPVTWVAVRSRLAAGIAVAMIASPGLIARGEDAAAPPPPATPESAEVTAPPDGSPETAGSPTATTDRREPVVITATRIETPLSQVGSSITVVSQEQMERRQQRSLVDALRDVPGVQVRRSGGPGSQTSLFTRGTESNHTLMLVDGVRVQDMASPSGTPAMDHLTVDGLDRVEVLRGPQSTLFGSDAIGGVVNMITRKGEGPPTLFAMAEGGSFYTHRVSAGSSGGDDLFNYNFVGSYLGSRSISAQVSDSERDPYRNTSFVSRFGFEPTEEFSIDFYFRYILAQINLDAGADFSRSRTESEQFIGKIEPRISLFDGVWEQRLAVSVHDLDRDNLGTGFSLPSRFSGRSIGIDWQHDLHLHEIYTLTLGLDHEYQEATFRPQGAPRIDADTSNTAFYMQHQLRLWERLFLTGGFRVDHHEEFGTEPTWRLAAAYHLNETGTIFRASGGSGFKAPTLAELFDTSFGSNNPNLDPQKSLGFDVGVEQKLFGDFLTLGATYFFNNIEDQVFAVFVGPGFQNVNIQETQSNGVETFVQVKPADNLLFRVGYTYTDTEAKRAAAFGIQDGSRLLRRPLHSVSADVTWLFLEERGTLTLGMTHVGRRDDLDPATFATTTAGDYTVVNLTGGFKITPNVEIFGRVENMLDKEYQEVLGFGAPGVAGYGGVKVTF